MISFGRPDPAKKLDKLPLAKLHDEEARLGLRAQATNQQLKHLRDQYDRLLSGRRPDETDNDVRLRASHARQLRPQIDRLQQDFDSLLAQQETITGLIEQRLGTEALRGAKRLGDLTGKMSDHELGKALEGRQHESERARAQTDARRNRLADTSGGGTGELSEEERLINAASAAPAPPPASRATPSKSKRQQGE